MFDIYFDFHDNNFNASIFIVKMNAFFTLDLQIVFMVKINVFFYVVFADSVYHEFNAFDTIILSINNIVIINAFLVLVWSVFTSSNLL